MLVRRTYFTLLFERVLTTKRIIYEAPIDTTPKFILTIHEATVQKRPSGAEELDRGSGDTNQQDS